MLYIPLSHPSSLRHYSLSSPSATKDSSVHQPPPVFMAEQEKTIMVGPWGSRFQQWFFYNKDNPHLTEIKIGYGEKFPINMIYFGFRNSHATASHPYEPNSTNGTDEVHLEETENIIAISGYYKNDQIGGTSLTSLNFTSNVRQYGPFGPEEGTRFLLPLYSGNIAGLFGDAYIGSIGFYLEPICQAPTIMVGPWGGDGPLFVLDDVPARLTRVVIYHGWTIDSLTFEYYNKDGKIQTSPRMGGPGGDPVEINLADDEYIKKIIGTYGTYEGSTVIRSLVFISNLQTYGPYGQEQENRFDLPVAKGKIAGFFGRAETYLSAVGVYLAY